MNENKEIFPPEDVEACLRDVPLQATNPFAEFDEELQKELQEELRVELAARRLRALEAGASEQTCWIFFSSPEWTWMRECGLEGWLLYDPETKDQLDFLMTVMN